MTESANVKLQCAKCGSANIVAPDNASESDWVSCGDCGERLVTIKQLNDEIARQAFDAIGKGVSGRLERVKGFKPS